MAGKKAEPLEVVHPDCAGIDVGKRKHYVAVDPSRFEEPVRNFGSFTEDLEAMAAWLSACGVREVAMESTGVYWIPVFEVLDRAGFEVHLVNPRATKQVSGRKSDVLDCQWIRQLMSFGLLRGAFRAPDALCPMRSYLRQRGQLVRDRSRAVQHMQKALTQMNVQLDNVLSDIMGKTGQLIVRAIVAGERDGAVLAKFRDGRCKARTSRRTTRGRARAASAHCGGGCGVCSASTCPPFRPSAWRRPWRSPRKSARTCRASPRRPTSARGWAWRPARASAVTGGWGGPPTRQANRVGQALRMAASTARNSKTAIGAAHRRRLSRMDSAKAVKATAHQLAPLIYAMLTRGEEYVERDLAAMETERRDRQIKHLLRQARHFGLALVPAEQAA